MDKSAEEAATQSNLDNSFLEFLEQNDNKELAVQEFLEQHSELIPLPYLLGHHLHFDAVISKFPLSTSLITDFVYLTKQSDSWWIVLMELEQPSKKLFTEDRSFYKFSAEFNAALAQIEMWRYFIKKHEGHVIDVLSPLLAHMNYLPIAFRYVLIYGRRKEIEGEPHRLEKVADVEETRKIRVLTYDSLITHKNAERPVVKNILALSRDRFRLKRMNRNPNAILSSMTQAELDLTDLHKQQLRDLGYSIDEWEQGKRLIVGGMKSIPQILQENKQELEDL